jgi:pimeloyl-ACP methyl ester carboxylesterase
MTYVHAAGHRLEYQWLHPRANKGRRHGDDAPVLVFLHEGLGSAALWKNFPALVVEGTRCPALVYSRYGYGESDRLTEPRTVDYMHKEALDALPQVLEALSVRDPILIGHSDGASIAIIHAGSGRWPVRGLVLMSPHVFVEDVTVASIAQAKTIFETSDLGLRLGRYHDDAAATFGGWNNIWLDPDFRAWNIEPYLASITAPVLLIQGQDDQYGTSAQVEAIALQVKGPVETMMLQRCAHSPHVDQTQATLGAIVRFVANR